jgi:hypothetical protein
MATDDRCSGCAQKHACKSIYEALGRVEGPGVVRKVLFIFLFPLVIFIISAAGLFFVFKERIASESVRTAVTFALAALTGLASAGLVRRIAPGWGQPCHTDPNRNLQNGTTWKEDI